MHPSLSALFRQRAAAAASIACGVPPERGRAWLDAAKEGHLGTLASMLSASPALLHYQVGAGGRERRCIRIGAAHP